MKCVATEMEEKIQMLLDQKEISEAIARYGLSFDMRDWMVANARAYRGDSACLF